MLYNPEPCSDYIIVVLHFSDRDRSRKIFFSVLASHRSSPDRHSLVIFITASPILKINVEVNILILFT